MSDLRPDENGGGGTIHIYSGPEEVEMRGIDVTAWRWFIQGNEFLVKITNTAMEIPDGQLPLRTAAARLTQGESEVLRFLDWEKPPPWVLLHTEDTIEGAGYE